MCTERNGLHHNEARTVAVVDPSASGNSSSDPGVNSKEVIRPPVRDMSSNLTKSSKLLALPPDVRAQIWDQVLTPWTIQFRHTSIKSLRFRANLCAKSDSDKTNAAAPHAARKTYGLRHRGCQDSVAQAL
nr:hypothetical protein B0A51_13376 [Rachicladosporium sp. CCFEE 5018]